MKNIEEQFFVKSTNGYIYYIPDLLVLKKILILMYIATYLFDPRI